jgi:PTH1 family peptidyl-tRNA hydrolase
LQNPGAQYSKTRHNAGSWFVNLLANTDSLAFKDDRKLRGEITTLNAGNGIQCGLFLPSSFMNLSGECVLAVCQFYKIAPHELLVVHDDLDLPAGVVRLKVGGGHAGHNGLRDIISRLSSSDFNRLRIGIGRPHPNQLVVDYVLGKPTSSERELIDSAIFKAANVIATIVKGDFSDAMQKLHVDLNK